MNLDTRRLKLQYRALCKQRCVPCTKAGLRLFKSQARCIAAVQSKEKRGQRVSLAEPPRAGMPIAQKGEERT